MRSELFYWLLNMSLHGGLVCGLVLLLRRIFPRIRYILWLAPLLRLTVPVGIPSSVSLMALLKPLHTTEVYVLPYSTMMNTLQIVESYMPFVYKSTALQRLFSLASLLWSIGAAACLLTAVILAVFTRRELRGARLLSPGVRESDRITSPALYGIFRPTVILPPNIPQEVLPHVLRHEAIHKRRRDNLWRAVAIGVCCIHWFNPMVWLSLKYFFEDMELSCDAAAIRPMKPEERKQYALSLLYFTEKNSLFAAAFGGARVRLRIEQVLSYRQLTLISLFAFHTLAVALIVILTLN